MSVIVLKADPGLDFYVGWSTEFEAPVWWGSRVDARRNLDEDAERPYGDRTDPAGRLARADCNGTSALGGFSFFGHWSDERLTYEQRGCLPRGRLVEACRALSRGDEAAVWDLLEPFEEGMVVRRG